MYCGSANDFGRGQEKTTGNGPIKNFYESCIASLIHGFLVYRSSKKHVLTLHHAFSFFYFTSNYPTPAIMRHERRTGCVRYPVSVSLTLLLIFWSCSQLTIGSNSNSNNGNQFRKAPGYLLGNSIGSTTTPGM